MRIFCLGSAGKISRESVCDLVAWSDFERITIGDFNESAGREVVTWLDDPRVDFVAVDVTDVEATAGKMRGYDVVMDGTPISMNDLSTQCILAAGLSGINLNGCGAEWKYDRAFKDIGRTLVPGFGMTPGITNMMVRHAADRLDTVETIRISHGAFRPIAFSPAIAETTRWEYDPALDSRVVYEDGQMVQVPPFARPLEVALPEPFGTHTQYIIPHAETVTLARTMADKGVRLIEVRGTWPPPNMALVRQLHEWGFTRNDTVRVGEVEVGVLDAVCAHLVQSQEGQQCELCGYALHVDVTGTSGGNARRYVQTHTHPASDGSVAGWAGLRAYTRNVGIPMSIGAQLIAAGSVAATGAIAPEEAFEPQTVFAELHQRGIDVHEQVLEN